MLALQRGLISVAALALSFGGLAVVAQAAPAGSVAGAVAAASPDTQGPLKANNPGNQTSTVGTTISLLQLSCSGGFPPCFWTVTGLPPGLTFNVAGQINGTPTTAGTFHVTATTKDTHNTASSTSFTWTVNAR
jgi:hypothetical protein